MAIPFAFSQDIRAASVVSRTSLVSLAKLFCFLHCNYCAFFPSTYLYPGGSQSTPHVMSFHLIWSDGVQGDGTLSACDATWLVVTLCDSKWLRDVMNWKIMW